MKVCFVITGMNIGGAERMLLKLLSTFKAKDFSIRVVSLTTGGELREEFLKFDSELLELNFRSLFGVLLGSFRLALLFLLWRPNIVQTWMYHGDLIGGIIAKICFVPKIIWSIRNSTLDQVSTRRTTLLIVRLLAFLSRFIPNKIVSCSHVASRVHQSLGYSRDKLIVIPNGFDLNLFGALNFFDKVSIEGHEFKEKALDFCFLARFDPQKNHLGFLDSLKLLVLKYPKVKVGFVGTGCDAANTVLVERIVALGLSENCILFGQRSDVEKLLKCFRFLVLPSIYGEAFPNVLGEAMASGLPCVATDVGDASYIIGDCGFVVPPGKVDLFYHAMVRCLLLNEAQYADLSLRSKSRVSACFDLDKVSEMYLNLYREV